MTTLRASESRWFGERGPVADPKLTDLDRGTSMSTCEESVSGVRKRRRCRLRVGLPGTGLSDVERMWHMQDSQGPILALALRKKAFKRLKLFPFRSEAVSLCGLNNLVIPGSVSIQT